MALGNRFGRKQEFAFHFGKHPRCRAADYSSNSLAPAEALRLLLRLLARLPLAMNHAIGAFVGRVVFALPGRYRRRVLENLAASGVAGSPDALDRLARENAAEIGKGATELAWALFRSIDEVAATVTERLGWDQLQKLRAEGKPIVFVTPHLGG